MTRKQLKTLIDRYNRILAKYKLPLEKATLTQLTATANSEKDYARIASNLNEIFKPGAFDKTYIGEVEVPRFLKNQFERNLKARNEMVKQNELTPFKFDPSKLRSIKGVANLNQGFNRQAGSKYLQVTNEQYYQNYYNATYALNDGYKIRRALTRLAKENKVNEFVDLVIDEQSNFMLTIFEIYNHENMDMDESDLINKIVSTINRIIDQ